MSISIRSTTFSSRLALSGPTRRPSWRRNYAVGSMWKTLFQQRPRLLFCDNASKNGCSNFAISGAERKTTRRHSRPPWRIDDPWALTNLLQSLLQNFDFLQGCDERINSSETALV